MKLSVLILLLVSITVAAFAQGLDVSAEGEDFSDDSLLLQGEVIKMNDNAKDARLAMVMSMLVPGTGNFYANKSSFTTYIWPVLEIGLWAGFIYYRIEGDKITDDYEKFADDHYSRDRQHHIEPFLREKYLNDVYDDTFWRLDDDNSQHFYEDISKYDKYVFGWSDWYDAYATDSNGDEVTPIFYGDGTDADFHWNGNQVMNSNYNGWPEDTIYSALRAKHIAMRKDAQKQYDKATMITFGILMNHILSAADAIRLTVKHNSEQLVANDVKLNYCLTERNNRLTPFVYLTKRF
ncbi:MAG: hypothetical protein JXR56_00385 [Candidatus Cloacimonetes bacterium]|nr:hypothetical protein [Candidatus Cloacimonadota bacterium]